LNPQAATAAAGGQFEYLDHMNTWINFELVAAADDVSEKQICALT
jgi:hypothetical protein